MTSIASSQTPPQVFADPNFKYLYYQECDPEQKGVIEIKNNDAVAELQFKWDNVLGGAWSATSIVAPKTKMEFVVTFPGDILVKYRFKNLLGKWEPWVDYIVPEKNRGNQLYPSFLSF